jgi:glucose-6-phosphate 1-epimerase
VGQREEPEYVVSSVLPRIQLRASNGAAADIYSHGAHVTSWIPAAGVERLFLSAASEFRSGAAIRGGVPIIFPQFAAEGPLLKHGFARISEWQLMEVVDTPAGSQAARFELRDSEGTRALWPHAFAAEYVVTVGGSMLTLTLEIDNSGSTPFDFTVALHTYLQVSDIGKVAIPGLRGIRYRDSAQGNTMCVEQQVDVTIEGEVDRIYYDTPAELVVIEADRTLLIRSQGFTDTVIWNPGPEKGAALKDMEPDGYIRMLCIEAAVIGKPIHLEPGQRWQGVQELHAYMER